MRTCKQTAVDLGQNSVHYPLVHRLLPCLTGDDNAELGDQSFQYINVRSTHDDLLLRGAVRVYIRCDLL